MACDEPLGAYVPDDWDAEGGGVAGAAAALLRALGYGNAFCSPPPARLCCEPIVLTQGALEREARLADGAERGRANGAWAGWRRTSCRAVSPRAWPR